MMTRSCLLLALSIITSPSVLAQFAFFANPTDTIRSGNTIVSSCTFEAVVVFTPTHNTHGFLFNEWTPAAEDKLLQAGGNLTGGFAYNLSSSGELVSTQPLTLYQPHHLAYVYSGSQERLYIDGALVASRTATGTVDDHSNGVAHIGAQFRDGGMTASFIGYIDSLRISDTARYSGSIFTPTLGDFASDSNTRLLYNFNEAAGSTTVTDSSSYGLTGTLGVGFTGATSPTFVSVVPVPEAEALLLGFACVAMLMFTRWSRS